MTALRKLAQFNWLTDFIMPVSIALMQACWAYLWLAWIGHWPSLAWQQPPLSLPRSLF